MARGANAAALYPWAASWFAACILFNWSCKAAPARDPRATATVLTARQDFAEDFSRLKPCTAMAWIFIPAHCFAIP